ncbi:MAG: type II toxin-antitoxin system VapC family toxin [Candidatus Hydrogenedentes bacterium]|nr:type II toxin-antitoxin system VapC family toxin [Candidatus Hydrogenedentota bacterium]
MSDLVIDEIAKGDPDAARLRLAAVSEFDILKVTQDAIELGPVYLKRIPLPAKASADAVHLAVAVLNGMDYFVTWNCRHFTRGSVIRALPIVNGALGLSTPTICTPEELMYA